jgi:Uma2 family endonuclease
LTVEEFLRRWDETPGVKERGTHRWSSLPVLTCQARTRTPRYADHSVACPTMRSPGPVAIAGITDTWLLSGSAPQPDAYLRIWPSHGGQSGSKGPLGAGAPEWAVEISISPADLDLGRKLALYETAGVREYTTIEAFGQRLIWRVLENAAYLTLTPHPDGIVRSQVFRACGWTWRPSGPTIGPGRWRS